MPKKSIKELSDMVNELTDHQQFLSKCDKLTGNRKSIYSQESAKLTSIIEQKQNLLAVDDNRKISANIQLSPVTVSCNNYNYIN